jgi:mono/diheme cytochrome c family protein
MNDCLDHFARASRKLLRCVGMPRGYPISTALLVALLANSAPAAPVVLGLSNKHPLSEPQIGELLLGELRCAACHRRSDRPALLERAAPDLSDVGSRVAPEFLRRFIASPSASHSGTTMPDMLMTEPADQRDKIAEAITHFLVAQSPHTLQREAVGERDASLGKVLFHTVGCIACHSPRDESGKEITHEGVVELGHIPAKYSLNSLSEFLFQPTHMRPSGRMPDMKLTPVEAKAIASYLLEKADTTAKSLQPRDELVALGKKYFQQFNCAACHKLGDIPAAATARDLSHSNPTRGCLAATPSNSPRFHLSVEQTKAIQAALAKKAEPISDKTLVAMTLTAFNCIACHVRDDFGGVSPERNPYFQTSEKNLGDDARIPPPLTLVGAKLQTAAMKKVFFDGDSVRSYMFTRMPQFGEANLRALPDLFSRLDAVENIELPIPSPESPDDKQREREKALRAAGQELLGDRGLYCVACHNFNGKPSPNNKGIDLIIAYQRLKPSWFYHFLVNPGAYRPRIVMPLCWPGGKAVQKTILDGDTHAQINAIWYYLSLGTSAQDPSGIHSVETKLRVTDATRTYRGRSSVAGYRGIAVGFPDGLSYAFNAQTGTLTTIWRGDFVRVDRSGQGSGGFQPAGRFVQLAQDVSFLDLANVQAPWPLRPTTTQERPVDPDPLYPKNHGYQFKGYYLDDGSIPTFMYRSGEIEIEDRSIADTTGKKPVVRRTFAFSSPRDHTVWFRALTGKIEAESNRQFKTSELRLGIPPIHTLLRTSSADRNASELLLRFDLPKGTTTVSLTYELLQ